MNILITSAGKRVALIRAFMKAAAELSGGTKILTTDMNPAMAPAAYASDGCLKVPPVTHEDYPERLLKLCLDNRVAMVIPTIDTELRILAACKAGFASHGIHVIVSDPDFIDTCRDKRNTRIFFETHAIRTPAPIDRHNPTFPIFAKPYNGSLSANIHLIENSDALTPAIMNDPTLLFMEYIDRKIYREYTVDMYYGRDHRLKCLVPRERIEIRAGEINKGRTARNEIVGYLKDRLGHISGCVGCICTQLFFHPLTHDIIGIEINPRFGGGYPLSYAAGADYPAYLIREYFRHETLEYTDDWKDNMLMLRYDDAIYI